MALTSNLSAGKRLKAILNESFDLVLKKHNFREKSNLYVLASNNLTYFVTIYKCRTLNKKKINFRIEWGILLNEDQKKPEISFRSPALGGSHDDLLSHAIPHWFTIKESSENHKEKDAKTKKAIAYLLNNIILPFLFSFQNIQDIIIFLEAPRNSLKDLKRTIPMDGGQTFRWLACLYYFVGQPQKSIEILDKEIQVSGILPFFEKNLIRLRKVILDNTNL